MSDTPEVTLGERMPACGTADDDYATKRATLATTDPWHPDMGWTPSPTKILESYAWVVAEASMNDWIEVTFDLPGYGGKFTVNTRHVTSIGQWTKPEPKEQSDDIPF